MWSLRDTPIRRKSTIVTVFTSVIALLLAGVTLFAAHVYTFRQDFIRDLSSLAKIIAQSSQNAVATVDARAATDALGVVAVQREFAAAWIQLPSGVVLARLGDAVDPSIVPQEPQNEYRFEGRYLNQFRTVTQDGNLLGTVVLRSDYHHGFWGLAHLYGGIFGVVLIAVILLAFLLSLAMQRSVSKPILDLARIARVVAERRDYSLRVPKLGADEVGQLTDAFNTMLERIQAQDVALLNSRERFAMAVEGSSDGIWDWDLRTDKVYLSPRWKEMLGFKDTELENSLETWNGQLDPEDREMVHGAMNNYLSGRSPSFKVEFRMLHKDGGRCWILARGAARRDKDGKPERVAGSHTDITARKQAEEALELSQRKFEKLVNAVNGVVWEADPRSLKFTFVSQQAELLLGYPRRQWVNEPCFWQEHIHPDDREWAVSFCVRSMAVGAPYDFEYRMLHSDGRVVWIRDSVAVEMEAGRPVLLRGILLDITEKKLAETERADLNKKLVETSRHAGMAEVATGVLHNVGNVLNSVNVAATLVANRVQRSKVSTLGKVAGLLRDHKADLPAFLSTDPKGMKLALYVQDLAEHLSQERADQLKELEALTKNVEHIKQIVAMQQSYAKVSGIVESLEVAHLVEDALDINSSALGRHRIAVIRQYAPVPRVSVDKHKALQILVNLINNAKYAMDQNQDEKRLVLEIAKKNGEFVQIKVTDNGLGIAQANLTRIFSHGFTTKKDGHGFGLHSGANAAKEMGGALIVQSGGLGLGATFILELPLNKEAANRPAQQNQADPATRDGLTSSTRPVHDI